MRALIAATLFVTACNQPIDYPPAALAALGLHNAPTYAARDLMLPAGMTLLALHPRLGQPAIRRPGDAFDVAWIARDGHVPALTLDDGEALPLDGTVCDSDGICHATAYAPDALGLHAACFDSACTPGALDVVAEFADPATFVQVSDVHVGDGDSLDGWQHVVDAINTLAPPPAFVVFTGDGADLGLADQRHDFIAQLQRLAVPVFVVTGNHDMDNGGLVGHLLEVGAELDFSAKYGALKLLGLSSGQDLDDGDHLGRLSESSGPDDSQLAWLGGALVGDDPTIVFFHHPLFNGLFGTVGPARDQLLALVTRDSVRAVLVGHVHITEVYDRDGESRDLSTGSQVVPSWRWPLHYTCSRSTNYGDGFAVHTIGSEHVEYRWVALHD